MEDYLSLSPDADLIGTSNKVHPVTYEYIYIYIYT